MAFVKNQVKTNNSIGETLWQNVTQKWDMIEGISKSGLDFKIDEYALTSKLLKYSKPTYAKVSKASIPSTTEITINQTTMTSV